jgi:hypothetical protein
MERTGSHRSKERMSINEKGCEVQNVVPTKPSQTDGYRLKISKREARFAIMAST